MEHIPIYVSIIFCIAVLATILLFYQAAHRSRIVLFGMTGWLMLQGIPALNGFFSSSFAMPPRIALALLPPLLFIAGLFLSRKGKQFIDSLDLKFLTLISLVRIPIEAVLFLLFIQKAVPQVMTFEGRNFDILSGLSAPIVYYLAFYTGAKRKSLLLAWNFICLGLLLNVVLHAVLATPYPFQQIAFDQPNRAIFYFPFTWLPALVVPVVLLSHLASIRQLTRKKVLLKTEIKNELLSYA